MTELQMGPILGSLAVLLTCAHLLGKVAAWLGQPRFVGELAAGVVLGPCVLGQVAPELSRAVLGQAGPAGEVTRLVIGSFSWLGLLLLMFASGSEVQHLLVRDQLRPTAWLIGLGTALPMAIAFAVAAALPLDWLRGPSGGEAAFLFVVAAAVGVTSIPVISRILHDLGLLHTRFAGLILGVAMLEDVVLFAALSVLTPARTDLSAGTAAAAQLGAAAAYLAFGLVLAPRLFRSRAWLQRAQRPGVPYVFLLLLAYTALAALLGVNLVLAGFLAGFGAAGGLPGTLRERLTAPLDALRRVAFGTFIPLYFAWIGARLQLGLDASALVLLGFLCASSLVRGSCALAASCCAGFRLRDAVDLAIALNARGGPGIVLATLALEAGVIVPELFTALVVTAVLTSQAAGWWLARVLRSRSTLLGEAVPLLQPAAARVR